MTRKVLFSFVLSTLITLPLIAQGSSQGLISPNTNLLRGNQNMKFGMEVGTSFSSFGGGFSLFSNQVSPYMQFQVSPKFSMEIGASFSHYNSGNSPFFPMSGNQFQNTFTGISGYARGRYQASERLSFSGSVFRQSTVMPALTMNPGAFEFLNQGMSMGFDYKISDRFSFGAGVQVMQTSSPFGGYNMHNRNRNPFYRPFGY